MARKGWATLSPGYRARLEKAGISQDDYEQGESIQSARGHSQTPERPTQTNNNFPIYQQERQRLVGLVTRHKQDFFGTSPKWNPLRASRMFREKPPPMARLRYWAGLDREEWLDAIREDPDSTAYLGYH